MATFVIDRISEYVVKAPTKDTGWITLAERYLAYESALPLAEQLPLPALTAVNAEMQAANSAASAAAAYEHERAGAAELYGEIMKTVEEKLVWAIDGRARQFPNHPAQIEPWGVDTVQGANGRRIVYPALQEQWRLLLDNYIAKEESLPLESQWTDPPLAEFETLREQLETRGGERDQALMLRKQNVKNRKDHVVVLKGLLNLAQHNLIVTRFNQKVTLELENWGFNVVYRSSKTSSNGSGDDPVTEPAETETDPTPAAG